MRLTELCPRWTADFDILVGDRVAHDEDRRGMGLSFACPHCVAAGQSTEQATRLGVFFRNPVDGKPHTDDVDDLHLWTRTGETFADLTLSPSIDVSKRGHWHGRIVNGDVT